MGHPALEYYLRLLSCAYKEGRHWGRDQLIGVLLAVAILFYQIKFGLISPAQLKATGWSLAYPYLYLLGGFIIFHLVRAAWKLDDERNRSIVSLKNQLAAFGLNITLTHVSGGGEAGMMYSEAKSWFWLISNLTVVNLGAIIETVAIELQVPNKGNGFAVCLPLTQAPLTISLPNGTALFGALYLKPFQPKTGALLFELDRSIVPKATVMNNDTGERVDVDVPDTQKALLVVRSLLSGAEQPFGAIDLMKR